MIPENTKYWCWLLVLITVFSCERDVEDVKLPEFKQKLVITSFISPSDSISYVRVSSNRKIFGELNIDETTGNLAAFLSDDSNEVVLDTTGNGFKINRGKIAIKYGKSYKLKVESDKGLSAEATCTVPLKRNFSLKADTFTLLRQSHDPSWPDYRTLHARVIFLDFRNEENYYRLFGMVTGYYTNPNTRNTWIQTEYIRFDQEYLTDNGMDGKEIIQSSTDNLRPFSGDSCLIKIYLLNTEKSYYLYHKSLDNYNSDENPFAEVTPVFSNVKGGLGIFASYTMDSVVLRIK